MTAYTTYKSFLGRVCCSVIILFFFHISQCYCQQDIAATEHSMYVGPSPDASGLMRFANVPVNQYTGIPTINVPIDGLQGRKINTSVSLSYHASGIKVSDVASSVGLGWVLNGGGVVTRLMRGLPDENSNGYQYTGRRVTSRLDTSYLHTAVNNKIDAEPDAFFFNFMGHSGKVVIDTLGNAQYLPDQGIRVIQHPIHNNLSLIHQAWILKDLNGYTYTFGQDGSSQEVTTAVQGKDPAVTFTSSWFLVSVVSPDGQEKVNFNYQTGPDLTYTQYRHTFTYEEDVFEYRRRNILGHTVNKHREKRILSLIRVDQNMVITITQAKYLRSITTDNGMIGFYYSARQDVSGGQMLTSIQVYNSLNLSLPLKIYMLSHSYFVSPQASLPLKPDAQRLRLDCVQLQGKGAEVKQPFVFTYNLQTMLPPRDADDYDHWGYYTTLDNREGFPSPETFVDAHHNVSYGHEQRVIDSVRMQANILTRIRNQNGGYTALYYEPHTYFDVADQVYGKGGGLRIVRMEVKDSIGTVVPIVNTYSYLGPNGNTSGELFSTKPYYVQQQVVTSSLTQVNGNNKVNWVDVGIKTAKGFAISSISSVVLLNTGWLASAIGGGGIFGLSTGLIGASGLSAAFISSISTALPYIGAAYVVGELIASYVKFLNKRVTRTLIEIDYYAVFSLPLNNLYDVNGSSVSYSQVSVSSSDGSSTKSRYTGQVDAPDSAINIVTNYNFNTIYREYCNGGAYSPNTSFSFARGLLKEGLAYDKNNNLVSRVVNNYQFSPKVAEVSGMRVSIASYVKQAQTGPLQVGEYHIGSYKEIAQNVQLVKTTTELYDQVNFGRKIVDTNSYTYSVKYPTLVHSTSTLRSDGKKLSSYYSYPFDYLSGTSFIDNMVSNQVIGSPIETLNVLTDQSGSQQITGGKLNVYYTGGKGLLDTVYSLAVSNPIALANFKVSNHSFGILDGPSTVYLRDKHYVSKGVYQVYDAKNNLTQFQKVGASQNSFIYDYGLTVPIASVQNASLSQIAYTSFETLDQRYWTFAVTGRDSSGSAKTGNIRYQLSKGALSSTNAFQAGTYLLSYWTNGGPATVTGYATTAAVVSGEKDGYGWVFYEQRLTLAANAKVSISGSSLIDEVRLYPFGAHISTSTYLPQVGLLSSTSANNKTNYYDYDGFERIKRVRDDHHNILKDYTYVNILPIACTQIPDTWVGADPKCSTDQTNILPNTNLYTPTLSNDGSGHLSCTINRYEKSYDGLAQFTVSFNTGAIYSGEMLLKTGTIVNIIGIPLGDVSAASATSVAIDTVTNFSDDYAIGSRYYTTRTRTRDGFKELNTRVGGQGYFIPALSNVYGCITFYNKPQTNFFKNDCASGNGSFVEYTVAAGTDTSSLSQHAADIKAYARGQAYANLNGSCTRSDTTWQGINPSCISSVADAGSPVLSAFTVVINSMDLTYQFVLNFSRSSAELNHDVNVNYTITFNDGSVLNYTTQMYNGIASMNMEPPLLGYDYLKVRSVVINSASYVSLSRRTYRYRQRYVNGVLDGYQEINTVTGGLGFFIPPVADPSACNTWYYNTAQAGFTKNNCPGGQTGLVPVNYTVPAHIDSSLVSQDIANILARSRGQQYANTYGACNNAFVPYVSTIACGFNNATGIAVDKFNNVYVASPNDGKIYKISVFGVTTVYAGTGANGYLDGPAKTAQFNYPFGVAVDDNTGNIYVADFLNNKIRKITPAGIVSTVASSASNVSKIFCDKLGYVYFENGSVISKVSPAGIVTNVPNTTNLAPNNGMRIDKSGNLAVLVDAYTLHLVSPTGNLTSIPITGVGSNDDLECLEIDASGNYYIADGAGYNQLNYIYKTNSSGVLVPFAGNIATNGSVGKNDGPLLSASFNSPYDISIDRSGNFYVIDSYNGCVRKIIMHP